MKSDRLDIGNRMKRYEAVSQTVLSRRLPAILRIDGRAFHTLTRRLYGRSWSEEFCGLMQTVALRVTADAQGCEFSYSQSDEISFLLTDYATIKTDAWFDYNVSKVVSIAASTAASTFSLASGQPCAFDARCFTLPLDEVTNYFIWRQIDATRNAIQFAAREHFSHKQLNGLSCNELQEKLFQEAGVNFNDYPTVRKRGFCLLDTLIDLEPPVFTKDREYIERFVNIRED